MSDVDLDVDQAAAAGIDPGGRQIVLAPPGSGKTEVVVQLLKHLVEDEDLSAFDEVLVISFSRAAIHALQRRAKEAPKLSGLGIRTLDSLASEILGDLEETDDWLSLNFDARIARALERVTESSLPEQFEMLRHVVVDEAQDLVGPRADLVLEIIRQISPDAGFTLLGDPLQAVYNFQLVGGGETTTAQFFDRVRSGGVQERRLATQYRARTAETREAAGLGLTDVTDDVRVAQVRDFVAKLLITRDVADLVAPMARWDGSTAFLCRNNGLALEVADRLRVAGLRVTVRSPSEELPIDNWVARILGDRSRMVSKSELEGSLAATPLGAEGSWRLLKRVERDFRTSDRLDVDRLSEALMRGSVPIDLRAQDADLIVSTIHRCKGLEFDNVVLVNSRDLVPPDATIDDAAVAYVASTRARDRVLAVRCDMSKGVYKDKVTGRWIRGGHQKWMTFGFEVRAPDTSAVAGLGGADVEDLVGSTVAGRINPDASGLDVPVWDLVVSGRTIARTTRSFGELFTRRVRPAKVGHPWPELSGLVVEAVETRIQLDQELRRAFVLAPRIGGLAALHWN